MKTTITYVARASFPAALERDGWSPIECALKTKRAARKAYRLFKRTNTGHTHSLLKRTVIEEQLPTRA